MTEGKKDAMTGVQWKVTISFLWVTFALVLLVLAIGLTTPDNSTMYKSVDQVAAEKALEAEAMKAKSATEAATGIDATTETETTTESQTGM